MGNNCSTHINDPAQRADRIWPVDGVRAAPRVLHDGARHHDDVLCRAGNLLDDEVHHLAEARVLVLEQLRDAKEERRGLIGRELLARVEQQRDLGEKDTASPRLDRRAVEQTCCGRAYRQSGRPWTALGRLRGADGRKPPSPYLLGRPGCGQP